MNGSGMAVAVRNITNTGCFLPHGVRSVASNLRPVWVLCVWIFTPENFPKIFRYANSHSRMYRGSDVFAEVQRYFYGNYVYGSKIAVSFPRNGKCITGLDGSYVINVSRQG